MINDSVFVRAVENTRKHHENLLLTKCQRRNHLVLEPNYYTTKWFSENLLVAETKKAKVFMNKSVYINLVIFDILVIFAKLTCFNSGRTTLRINARLIHIVS